jgi:hypothetical protein
VDHLKETGYAKSINDIISSLWRHLIPRIAYPSLCWQRKRCLTSKRFELLQKYQSTTDRKSGCWIDWCYFQSVKSPNVSNRISHNKKDFLTLKWFMIWKSVNPPIIENQGCQIDWWRHFRPTTPPSGCFCKNTGKIRNIDISTTSSSLIGNRGRWVD